MEFVAYVGLIRTLIFIKIMNICASMLYTWMPTRHDIIKVMFKVCLFTQLQPGQLYYYRVKTATAR